MHLRGISSASRNIPGDYAIVLLVKDPFATPDHISGGGINLLANSNRGG